MFSRSSFSPVSFSAVSFNGALLTPAETARSGYWRLFYYQLQEESLGSKHDAVSKEEAVKDTRIRREDVPAAVVQKTVPKRKLIPPRETPPVRERPIYRKEKPTESTPLVPFLAIISREFKQWSESADILRLDTLRRRAEETEEDNIQLLLLAA